MKRLTICAFAIALGMLTMACGNNDNNTNANAQPKVTVEQAKQIALDHAKLPADAQVSFINADYEADEKVPKYEIEFSFDNKEYDYDIDANTGEIISFDQDIENYDVAQNATGDQKAQITVEQAQEIALKHANIATADAAFVRAEYQFDDGIAQYEVEFTSANKKYDYEINAITGEVLSYEKDEYVQ